VKILAYDDNPDYGGHQAMACLGIESLAAEPVHEIHFMLNPANRRLADRVSSIANVNILAAPCTSRRLESLKPDLLLCIQGDIRQSTKAIRTARRAGIECVSYLALPHTLKQMGATFGGLRDRLHDRHPTLPDRYILISQGMEQRLRNRGIKKPVSIVPNGITIPPASSVMPKPKTENPVLGMLGRIEFTQKRQDFMVHAFSGLPEAFGKCRLLITGDGPDRERLERIVDASPRRDDIALMPWTENTDSFYGQIDCLVLPSRFEGVPLVMLEALVRKIPVIASRCDGMAEWLPETWTFPPGDAAAMTRAFTAARSAGTSKIDALQQRVAEEADPVRFKERFVSAVLNP